MLGRRPRAGRWRRRASGVFAAIIATVALAGSASAQPIYGVVPQDGALPTASDIELMPQGGVQSIRLMAHWPDVQSTRDGLYDWSTLDGMVRETTNRGVQPLLFLYGTPAWAAHDDGRDCGASTCSVYPPDSPTTRKAFANFAAAAVKRYGPGGDFWVAPVPPVPAESPAPPPVGQRITCDLPPPLPCPTPPPPPPPSPTPDPTQPPCGCTEPHPIRTWQIWNEQNSPKYFAPAADVGKYAALVKATGDAIHGVDAGADVILGGMWGPRSAKKVVVPVRDYLTSLYEVDGIENSFDSIALHPYSKTVARSVAQLETARRVARRAGDAGVRMWVTELGWAAKGPADDPFVKGYKGQAKLLSRAMKTFERKQRHFHLRGVFWYSWRDRPGGDSICTWCGNAGLRAEDGSAKPAWRAFSRVATR